MEHAILSFLIRILVQRKANILALSEACSYVLTYRLKLLRFHSQFRTFEVGQKFQYQGVGHEIGL